MLDARGTSQVGASPMTVDDVIDEDKENSDTGSKNENSRGRAGAKPKTFPTSVPARGKGSRGGRAATTSRAKAPAATPNKKQLNVTVSGCKITISVKNIEMCFLLVYIGNQTTDYSTIHFASHQSYHSRCKH